jgi:hydrogenase maturation factor
LKSIKIANAIVMKAIKLKIGQIYDTTNCCREVRLDLLCSKLSVGQTIKGWRHYRLDERDGMEVWQVIEIDENDRNNCKVKFLGYEYG